MKSFSNELHLKSSTLLLREPKVTIHESRDFANMCLSYHCSFTNTNIDTHTQQNSICSYLKQGYSSILKEYYGVTECFTGWVPE